MKFHIRNMAMLSVLVSSSCAAQKDLLNTKAETKKNHQDSQSKAQKNFVGAKSTSSNVLIFQQGPRLEGVSINDGTTFVLRDSFLQGIPDWLRNKWSVSPNGSSLVFAGTPSDVDFFSVAAYRDYLFTASFAGQQKVLLAAYGPRAVAGQFSFNFPSWSADGKRIIVSQQRTGDYFEPSQIAIYDVATRKEVWDSRPFASKLPRPKQYFYTSLFYPALSPDGNDLVCFAIEQPNDGSGPFVLLGDKVPPTWIIHFDLKRKRSEVLTALDDQFSVSRYRNSNDYNLGNAVSGRTIRLRPDFTWHPTQKKFVFAGLVSSKSPTINLFTFDLRTRKMSRFSDTKHNDTSPRWSPDGKSVFWLRDGQIFRANANGTNPERILPQVAGMTKIQLLSKIADWSHYRKLAIEPLAGKDK